MEQQIWLAHQLVLFQHLTAGVLFERTPCNLTRRYTFRLYGGVPFLSRYFSAQAIISLLASPTPFRRTPKINQSLPFLTISKEMHVLIS